MLLLFFLLVILHIATAAAWFGMGLTLTGQLRALLGMAPPGTVILAEQTDRTVRLMGLFLLLTLAFALGAFFLGGGFGRYGPAYHTSLLLLVVLLGVHYGLLQPAWGRLQAAVAAGGDGTSARKRLAMAAGIGHLLWVVILVLMFGERLADAL
jgi:hypothetical protein